MITLTIQFPTVETAIAALRTLGARATGVKPAAEDSTFVVTAAVENAPVSAGATQAAAEPAAPPSAQAAADEPAPAALTYDAVHAAITQAVAGGRRPQVVAALAKFGAKKGPDLKPEQWADFVREVQA